MKDKKIIVLSIIINIVLVGIIYNLLNLNEKMSGEKQILKEMSTSEREEELDNQITALNESHENYAMQVQLNKKKIAEAITNKGVETSETASVEVMVENIGKLSDTSVLGTIYGVINTSTVLNYTTYTSQKTGKIRMYVTMQSFEPDILISGCDSISEFTYIGGLENGYSYQYFGYYDATVTQGAVISIKPTTSVNWVTCILVG